MSSNGSCPEPRGVPSHFFLQTPLSVLHELFSRCGLVCTYVMLSRPSGHSPDFVMQASVANMKATGRGRTKRAAKQSAIVHLLKALFRCPGTTSSNSANSQISDVTGEGFPNSAVDALHKFCESHQWSTPIYHVGSKSENKCKDQTKYVVTCVVNNTAVTGLGVSKKMAKKHAAFKMLFYQLSCLNSTTTSSPSSERKVVKKDDVKSSSASKFVVEKGCKKRTRKSYQNEPIVDRLGKSEGEIGVASGHCQHPEKGVVGDNGKDQSSQGVGSKPSGEVYEASGEEYKAQSLTSLLLNKSQGNDQCPLKRHYSERLVDIESKFIEQRPPLAPPRRNQSRQERNTQSNENVTGSNPSTRVKSTKNDRIHDKLSPEEAHQWLSLLLLKNMNLAHIQSQNQNLSSPILTKPEVDKNEVDNCVEIENSSRKAGGADADSMVNWSEPTTEVIRYQEIDSEPKIEVDQVIKEETNQSKWHLNPSLPSDSSTVGITRSLPEFAVDFVEPSLSTLPHSLSEESGGIPHRIKSPKEKPSNVLEESGQKSPKKQLSVISAHVTRFVAQFTWIESDTFIMERYAWGTSVYILPRFLAALVVFVEFLLGLLYLCTDHVTGIEMLYTFVVTMFLIFLLRAS